MPEHLCIIRQLGLVRLTQNNGVRAVNPEQRNAEAVWAGLEWEPRGGGGGAKSKGRRWRRATEQLHGVGERSVGSGPLCPTADCCAHKSLASRIDYAPLAVLATALLMASPRWTPRVTGVHVGPNRRTRTPERKRCASPSTMPKSPRPTGTDTGGLPDSRCYGVAGNLAETHAVHKWHQRRSEQQHAATGEKRCAPPVNKTSAQTKEAHGSRCWPAA